MKKGSSGQYLALYDQNIEQKEIPPSYQRFKSRAKKFKDQNLQNRHFEARNDRTATGPLAKQRGKGDAKAVKERREIATSGRQNASVPKETRAAKDTTSPSVARANTSVKHLVHPVMHHIHQETAVENTRTSGGNSPSGKKFQQSRQKYLKETCTNPSCNF